MGREISSSLSLSSAGRVRALAKQPRVLFCDRRRCDALRLRRSSGKSDRIAATTSGVRSAWHGWS
jgi:hypothetical protein